MSLRLEFVTLAAAEGANLRERCRRHEISPKTACKRIARHRELGATALADRSRRPASGPRRRPGPIESEVLRLRDANPARGGGEPRHERPRESPGMAVPAGRYRPSDRAFPEVPPSWEYGDGDQVREASGDGTIGSRNRALDPGEAFRGEGVATRPTTGDGLYGIYFGVHRVAQADPRVRNQPQ